MSEQTKQHNADLAVIRKELEQHKTPPEKQKVFYKTGPGDYAEHDQFMGVSVPVLRKIAKSQTNLALSTIQELFYSSINEERLLALLILVNRYQKADHASKELIFQFYLTHLDQVNNWNLVDSSAHLIIGAHLYPRDKKLLFELVESQKLWYRRIAIVASWYFIKNNDYATTLALAEKLLKDEEDLIQKAVGWMLRETGKKDSLSLTNFLAKHASRMPRTMLRYAIEKFDEETRKHYLLMRS